jgi:hypothetical protein
VGFAVTFLVQVVPKLGGIAGIELGFKRIQVGKNRQ